METCHALDVSNHWVRTEMDQEANHFKEMLSDGPVEGGSLLISPNSIDNCTFGDKILYNCEVIVDGSPMQQGDAFEIQLINIVRRIN